MPTPVGYAEMTVEMTIPGDDRPFACVFGIETDLATIPMVTHCDRVFAAWASAFLPTQPNTLRLERVVGRFGQDAADDLIAESSLTPVVGGSSASFLPQNVAVLIQKRTDLGGRKNRGRMYVPYLLNESGVDNVGVISGPNVTLLQTNANAFLASLEDTDPGPPLPMVILHRSSVDAPTLVTELRVDNVVATQRRRLRR